MFFSLVVPTYNESKNILELLQGAHAQLGGYSHEIIVVDDNSPDLTWKLAYDFSAKNPWVKVLRRTKERGLSSAVLAGFGRAEGEIFGVMDADLSHDEKILPLLIGKIEAGCDLAVGSRRIPGGGADRWPWYRRITSGFATMLAKSLLKLSLSDPMSGYFVLKRSLYESAKDRLRPDGYKILLELYCRARPKTVGEVPFIFKDRVQGYSKLSGSVMGQYLRMVLLLAWDERFSRKR